MPYLEFPILNFTFFENHMPDAISCQAHVAPATVDGDFWWPNLPGDMREVFRVVKPGGTLILIAEVYKGANIKPAKLVEKYSSRTGMTLLTANEHRELFTGAGYSDIEVIEGRDKGWICGIGRKPDRDSPLIARPSKCLIPPA